MSRTLRWRGPLARRLVVSAIALGALGCAEAMVPPGEPPAMAPAIPWLAEGAPPIAPPEVPWAVGEMPDPTTRPCPVGWRSVLHELGPVCEPWPEAGRVECTGATAQRPGEEGCTHVGRACPSGEFPDDVPADALFVRVGAAGTGTREAPLGTLAEAVALASPGQTVVLAAGEHHAQLALAAPVNLRGVCADRTHLIGPLRVAADVQLADVTVRSSGDGIVVTRGGFSATGVVVAEHAGHGIDVQGGVCTLDDVLVRGGTADASTMGGAIHVINGAITAHRVAVERAPWRGVVVDSRGALTMTDSSVVDGVVGADGQAVLALVREGAGAATFERVVFENGTSQLVSISGDEVTLRDVLARGARIGREPIALGVVVFGALRAAGLRTEDVDGFGLAATGRVEVEDYIAEGTHRESVGIHSEEGGNIVARRVRLGPLPIGARAIVRGAMELEDVYAGAITNFSLQASSTDSRAELRRVLVRSSASGLTAGVDSTVDIEDAIFEDIASTSVGDDAIGSYLRSQTTARRIRSTRVANSCFASLQEGASLTIEDATCDGPELGAVAAVAATLTLSRVRISGPTAVGLVAEEGASLVATDVVVEDVAPTEMVSVGAVAVRGGLSLRRAVLRRVDGYGVACFSDGTLDVIDVVVEDATLGGAVPECETSLTRVAFERAGVVGVSASTAQSIVHLSDVRVHDVRADPVDGRFGHGIHVAGGATVDGARVVVDTTLGAGVLVAGAASSATLSELWVSAATPSACGPGCTTGGSGLVVIAEARARVTTLRSFGHGVAGLQIASGGVLEITGGFVHDNAIGRNLPPDADVTPLAMSVTYVRNQVEEDRSALSLPTAVLF